MYSVLINIRRLALLIIAINFALNSSGEPSKVISSPLAPKHGCEPLSAAESASNGGSRCIGNAAGGGDAAADAAAGAGFDTDDELAEALAVSEAGPAAASAAYHRLDDAGRGDERVIATACFWSRIFGAGRHV